MYKNCHLSESELSFGGRRTVPKPEQIILNKLHYKSNNNNNIDNLYDDNDDDNDDDDEIDDDDNDDCNLVVNNGSLTGCPAHPSSDLRLINIDYYDVTLILITFSGLSQIIIRLLIILYKFFLG